MSWQRRRGIVGGMARGILALLICGCGGFFPGFAQSTILTPPQNGVAELELRGEAGNQVTVDAANELTGVPWETIGTLLLTNSSVRMSDPWCGTAPKRFYRVTRMAGNILPFAENFRLIDQAGRSEELHYYWNDTNISAFVLIFTANGCADVEEQLAELKGIQAEYADAGVVFWMINSNAEDTRADIQEEARRLGITWPVLHDPSQNAARVYGTRASPEVVCVDRASFSIFYQGAIDDRFEPGLGVVNRKHLREALASFTAGEEVIVRRTKPPGCEVELAVDRPVSYTAEIAPMLQNKCVVCHSPGNIAPWAMTNHAIVKIYSEAMKYRVMGGEMPPWHADPIHGRFKNDSSLTAQEQALLIAWIEQGALKDGESDPLETIPPPPPKWPVELGEPDLVLRAPVQQIKATGIEPYRYVFVETGLSSPVWLKAALVRPSNPRVVHHYLVWEGRTTMQMATGLAGYVPGGPALPFPEGTGVEMTDAWLTFNLHYTPHGEEAEDEPELALWFHDTPPGKTLQTLPLLQQSFVIPPGAREHEVRFEQVIPEFLTATVYRLAPHMHYRGKSMKYEVFYPDGTSEVLLSVVDYHFDWQMMYQLEAPKVIPGGSRIVISGTFDNSAQNLFNPDPTQAVSWGDQSFEEMFIGYADVTFPFKVPLP